MLGKIVKMTAIVAAAIAVSLGSVRAADTELPADVVAAAKKEGKVAFYLSLIHI